MVNGVILLYKNKKIAAIIPARKGSKGIPNKNIIELNGIPLVAHTFEEIKKSIIDKILFLLILKMYLV